MATRSVKKAEVCPPSRVGEPAQDGAVPAAGQAAARAGGHASVVAFDGGRFEAAEEHSSGQADTRLASIRSHVIQTRTSLEAERGALVREQAALLERLRALEEELAMVRQIDTLWQQPPGPAPSLVRVPLSRRVLAALRAHESGLTFAQLRDALNLDKKASRNLGPVLFHLNKAAKVVSDGRGTAWRLAGRS